MPKKKELSLPGFGPRLRAFRLSRGLTQAQVAGKAYTKAYISMLESGRSRASMKAVSTLAAALGVDPIELLGGIKPDERPSLVVYSDKELLDELLRRLAK